jgi:hypothetical protein
MLRPLVALVVALVLAACSEEAGPPPARTPTPLDQATTGTISGAVRFDGTPPPMREVNFGSFGECASQHQGAVTMGDVRVRNGAVAGAFVYVKDGLGNRVFAIPEGRDRPDGLAPKPSSACRSGSSCASSTTIRCRARTPAASSALT